MAIVPGSLRRTRSSTAGAAYRFRRSRRGCERHQRRELDARCSNAELMPRDFIWFVVKDRTTGAAVTDGYWSDIGSITAQYIDPDTGGVGTRTWAGAGSLIQISAIPLVSNLTVRQYRGDAFAGGRSRQQSDPRL